jgi:hypothetical protein
MGEGSLLDKAFNFIIKRMMDTGHAPHYTEIAAELKISVEEGRQAIHDLFSGGVPGWVFPDTAIPYHYRWPAKVVWAMRL